MNRRLVVCAISTLGMMNGGCAYLTTYKSSMDLASKSYSMDAKQRIVISVERKDKDGKLDQRIVCAEPSPDALATISASLGADFISALSGSANRARTQTGATESESSSGATTSSNTVNAGFAAAIAEQGAFIGIRTAAIQTMRDGLYAECQAYANGAVSDVEYTAFQRRHQSTMLGLIAIEQLTRPAVAQQVVLSSNAAAQTGTPPGDVALEAQQKRVDDKRKEDTDARAGLATAVSDVASVQAKLAENAREEQKARADAIAAEPDASKHQGAADRAAAPIIEKRKALQEEERNKIVARDAAQLRANAAAQSFQDAIADYKAAQGRAAASAGGTGQFGALRDASAQINADVVNGVNNIVVEVNQSYLRDGCFALMSELIKDKDLRDMKAPLNDKDFNPVSVLRTALSNCNDILQAEATRMLLLNTMNPQARQLGIKNLLELLKKEQTNAGKNSADPNTKTGS